MENQLLEIEKSINKDNILYIEKCLEEALPKGKFIIRFNVLDNKISILSVEYFSRAMVNDLALLFVEDGKIVNKQLYEHYYLNDCKELAELNNLLVSLFKMTMFNENENIMKFLKDYKNGNKHLIKILEILELDELCEHLLYDSLYEDPFARIELQNYVISVHGKVVMGDDRYCYSDDAYDFTPTSKTIQAGIGYLNAKIYTIYRLIKNYNNLFKK